MCDDQKVTPQYMNIKAGMDAVNKQSIARKVAELTKGTPKDLHQKQLQKKRALEVTTMIQKVMKFNKEQKRQIKQHWNKKINDMSNQRNLQRYWAHFDFDMFYVACQLLDKPQLKDKPCGVGNDNGVLATANYAARVLGIRSAMPTFIAKSICPELILLKSDFQKYRTYSNMFRQILMKFDENIQSQGLDEAYVDLTNQLQNHTLEEQHEIIANIRKSIFDRTGLTVSAGVGANKMLAKISSQVKKPNDQFILPNDKQSILEFMKNVKIRKIPGVGPINEYYLKGLGIQSASDILQNTDVLQICFSDTSCEFFIEAALGLGSIEHSFKQRKSVGRSETFKPTNDEKFLTQKLNQLCGQVERDLQELGFVSINVVFSYQNENYEKKDKSSNLDGYHKDKETLFNTANKQLQSALGGVKKLRLIGVRCSNLMKIDDWKRKSLLNYFAKQKTNTDTDQGRKYLLNQVRQKSAFICPICNKQIDCMNNISAMNRHVDRCLKGLSEPQTFKATDKKLVKVQESESIKQKLKQPKIKIQQQKEKVQKKGGNRGRPKKQQNGNKSLSSYFNQK